MIVLVVVVPEAQSHTKQEGFAMRRQCLLPVRVVAVVVLVFVVPELQGITKQGKVVQSSSRQGWQA